MSKQGLVKLGKISATAVFLAGAFVGCAHNGAPKIIGNQFQQVSLIEEGPVVAKTVAGKSVIMGGFSGLQTIEELSGANALYFWTVTDRGPNGEPYKLADGKEEVRPFINPNYNPRIYKLLWDLQTSTLSVVDEIVLKDSEGTPLSGLPNMQGADETPVDENGKPLEFDLAGIDPEGIAQDSKGNFWVCDEYRPSLMKFDADGKLLKKFVPRNAYSRSDLKRIGDKHGRMEIIEALPEEYNFRRKNRGFEGLTIKGNRLIVALQSPLRIPEAQQTLLVRLLEFDIETEKVVSTYLYPLDNDKIDKIGDVSWTADGLYVIEQNSEVGSKGVHRVFLVRELKAFGMLRTLTPPELLSKEDLGSAILKKEFILDLGKAGMDSYEKFEGISVMADGRIAISVDNDFGIVTDQKKISVDYKKKPVIAIFPKVQ